MSMNCDIKNSDVLSIPENKKLKISWKSLTIFSLVN